MRVLFFSSSPLMAEQKSRATMVEFSDRNMEDFATGVWMRSGETQTFLLFFCGEKPEIFEMQIEQTKWKIQVISDYSKLSHRCNINLLWHSIEMYVWLHRLIFSMLFVFVISLQTSSSPSSTHTHTFVLNRSWTKKSCETGHINASKPVNEWLLDKLAENVKAPRTYLATWCDVMWCSLVQNLKVLAMLINAFLDFEELKTDNEIQWLMFFFSQSSSYNGFFHLNCSRYKLKAFNIGKGCKSQIKFERVLKCDHAFVVILFGWLAKGLLLPLGQYHVAALHCVRWSVRSVSAFAWISVRVSARILDLVSNALVCDG